MEFPALELGFKLIKWYFLALMKMSFRFWITFFYDNGAYILALLFLICPNPPAYPYLWTLLVSVWSFAHFSVFFAYFLYVQFWVGSQSLKLKMK